MLCVWRGFVCACGGWLRRCSNGQLGCSDIVSRITPAAIRFAVSVRVVKVATGSRFSTALDSEGRLWSWGTPREPCRNAAVFGLRVRCIVWRCSGFAHALVPP